MTPSEVREALDALDAGRRARCFVLLCEPCLEHVRKYFADPRNRKYRDSVVGLGHEVDVDLPVRALSVIRAARGIPSASVLDSLIVDYQEPITAHQDNDLRISDERAEYAYLAIYNLIRSCKNPNDKAIAWLVVCQALSATGPEDPTQADVHEALARWVTAWPTA
jgi:hypothetical protein